MLYSFILKLSLSFHHRAYHPSDYEHLSVSPEISELFSYITRYTPQSIELEYRLRPYIPDYIPAVGDIDAFIKVVMLKVYSHMIGESLSIFMLYMWLRP